MKRIGHIVFVIALALSWCLAVVAQTKKLPDVTTTEGREFFVAWLPNGGSAPSSADLKLHLLASSRKANTIVVEFYNGATQTYNIAAGTTETIIVDPQSVYWDPAKNEEEIVIPKGLRVYSAVDERFTLYSINQTGAGTVYSFDGAHILPVEALGTEYMVQTADGDNTATELVVMSTRPGITNVDIQLTVNSRVGNTQQLSVTLNGPKQMYIVRSMSHDPDDLTAFIDFSGSTICADQPIAVWSGNQDGLVPYRGGLSPNHAYDQLLPLNKWGKNFIVPMTAQNMQKNIMRIVAMQDNTSVTIKRNNNVVNAPTLNAGGTFSQDLTQSVGNPNPQNVSLYVTADKPVQVYLYSSSAGMNTWYDDDGKDHLPGNPSMTLIPPLEFLTDTTIFRTYNGGTGSLAHQVNIWALTSQIDNIRLDGNPITTGWKTVPSNTAYSQNTYTITDGTHILTAPTKCFSGYAYGIDEAQAYLYPIGYDFTPKEDSLFLFDNDNQYKVHWSEWKAKALSNTEGGWYLDKTLLDNGKYLLDSIFVCDSSTLKLPIKTYEAWYKVRWEIEGSIQGANYFTPIEQLAEDPNVVRPELEHQFLLLPKERNSEPYEDFEVRGILIRKPIICDIPEEKWERDTFNTIVRVLRQYNDTVWKAICIGDTLNFFYDSLYSQSDLSKYDATKKDSTHFIATTSSATPKKWEHYVGLGSYTFTRHYISSGGCDSLSTLKLFVCQSHFKHKDTVICEDGIRTLKYGEFFKRFSDDRSWPIADTVLRDTLRAIECMKGPDWQEFAPHCKKFNGCDSVLELHLKVMPVVRNTLRVSQCMSKGSSYTWKEEKSGRVIGTYYADDYKKDTLYTIRDYVKYVNCEDCPNGGCDSVRNTLFLMFVSDAGQEHTIHICQGRDTTYRSSVNATARQYFDSKGKLCNTPYIYDLEVKIMEGSEVLCSFTDRLTFIIDTVYKDQMTYDTICWDPNATNQTYEWANHPKYAAIPITEPGLIIKIDTLPTQKCGDAGGCDSICVLRLQVGQPYNVPTTKEICDDGSFTWEDTLFYGAKYKGDKPAKSKLITTPTYTSRRDTISQYKCDSILTLNLTIHPTFLAERKDTFVCANEPYNFHGTWYNTPDNPWTPGDTVHLSIHKESIHGCDSAVLHYVVVYPVFLNEREANDTVCQVLNGEAYYEWPGAAHADWNSKKLQSLSTANTYELEDPLQTIHGCDSIIHRTLVVLPSHELTYPYMMSSEDTMHWEGRIYAGERAVFEKPEGKEVIIATGVMRIVDSLETKAVGTHVCDSVRILNLTIGQIFRDTTYDATCANCGTYEWTITSPITGKDTTIYITDLPAPYEQRYYYDSLKTAMGYDSIYVRILTAYPSYNYTDQGEVCQGEPFEWPGHMPMVYDGIEHRLFVNGQMVWEIPTDEHRVIEVVDSMRTDTIYTNPKTGVVKPMHCDSVWTLTLTVHPTYNDRYVELADPRSMASNDTISHFKDPHTLFVGYDFDFEAAGTSKAELETQYPRVVYIDRKEGTNHRDSVVSTSIYQCDSVHYVNIAICEVKFTQLYDSIGDNDTTWFFGGDASEHSLPLVTGEKFHFYDDGTPVKYDSAVNRHMREYLFVDTLRTATGCDSIVHDSVRVFPTYRFEFDTAVCSNTRYDWRGQTNLNRGRTQYYYDSVNYQIGTHTFDSVYVLFLDVMPSGFWQYDTILCMNDTILWHKQKIFYRPGGLQYVEAIYKDEESVCGDVYRMYLTFKPFYGAKLIEYDTICQDDPYAWISPNETIEHTEALRDEAGNPLSFIPTDQVGDFIFYDSLKTKGCGCDSVYTLHLHINPTHRFVTEKAICTGEEFEWIVKDQQGNDSIITYQSDVTTHIYDTISGQTATGCDSSYYLHVFVDQPYSYKIDTTLCAADEHFTWNGKNYDEQIAASSTWLKPQEYYDTIFEHTVRGHCDSTLYLHLTIAPSGDSIWTDSMCIGETYMLFEQAITQEGYYEMRHENYWGCDMNYKLTLRNIPATTFQLAVEPVCFDEEGVANSYILRYTYDGQFAPVTYSLHYDSLAHAIGFEDEEDIPLNGAQTLALPVPSVAQKTYPRPGYYDAVIAFKNGVCLSDSLMRYPFKMEMRYPAWIMEQRHNDVIALLNERYNGGSYTWSAYQWYENDRMMEGQTKPYLHVPTGLTPDAAYSVALTRTDDNVTVRTCPIIATYKVDNIVPTMGYLAVTPTCVVTGHPYVNILSRKDGTYRVTTGEGQLVSDGVFRAEVTEIQLPEAEGLYIVQLWSDATPEEPYRAVKVLVSKQCPNCDTSSF